MRIYDASNAPSWNLRRHGLTFIPKAIDRPLVEALREVVDFEYTRIENPTSDIEREIAASSASWGGIAIDHVKSLAQDTEHSASLVDRAISQLTIEVSRYSAMDPIFESGLSYVRRHKNIATFAPWHLDAHAAGTIKHDYVFNAWMPLVAVGRDCPSLEFIVGAHQRTRAGDYTHQESGHPVDVGYPTPEWIEENGSNGKHVCLQMEPGDVVIFDHWTPHRTQRADFGSYTRTSAEMRFHADKRPGIFSRLKGALS
jgi:ectoine hydroxylase-related dioxygenase (phytanoyl-CoA dioxygenase family)